MPDPVRRATRHGVRPPTGRVRGREQRESRRDAEPLPDAGRRAAAAVTQWPIPGTRYRADFGWPERGVVGEFDGLVKYGRGRTTVDEDMADVVWREKQREDRIRETGLGVVRWTWPEIDGGEMVTRLRKRLG